MYDFQGVTIEMERGTIEIERVTIGMGNIWHSVNLLFTKSS